MAKVVGSIDLASQAQANSNAVSQANEAIDSLELVGINLIPSSIFTNKGIAGTTKELGPVSIASLHTYFNINDGYVINDFEEGVPYTFRVGALASSPDAYDDSKAGPHFRFRYEDGTYTGFYFTYGQTDIVYKTMTSNPNKKLVRLTITYGNSSQWTFYDLKLEKGTRATDYTPSPDDSLDLINSSRSWYATCSTAAATVAKEATTADQGFELREGVAVDVKFTNTNTGAVASLTLNVNGTGAKSIKAQHNNAIDNLNHPGILYQNLIVHFVYNGTYWLATENVNVDTQNRTRWQNVIKAIGTANSVTLGHIICGTASGYRDIAAGVSFDLSYPLLYSGSTISAASGTTDNTYLSINGINLSTSGTIQGAAQYTVVYLKGTLSGNSITIASSNFLTCTIPTSADGFVYIPLGMFYNSTTSIYFSSTKELWAYVDGAFGPVSVREAAAAAKTAISYITHVDDNGITIHPKSNENNRAAINANGMEIFKDNVSVASYGDSARIGKENSDRVVIDPTNGITIYKGTGTSCKKRLQTTDAGIDIYGDDSTNSIASFGETVRVGKSSNNGYVEIDYHSLQLRGHNIGAFFHVSDLRDANGIATLVQRVNGPIAVGTTVELMAEADDTSYTVTFYGEYDTQPTIQNKTRTSFKLATAPLEEYVHYLKIEFTSSDLDLQALTFGTRGTGVNANPPAPLSASFGYRNNADGYASFAEGTDTTASGFDAHSEGRATDASGSHSHAENWMTTASGTASHAEGYRTVASSSYSHAEGYYAVASESYSHAEGYNTEAKHKGSHTSGIYTVSSATYQTVVGRYNADQSDALFIVGNGSSSARSNAMYVTGQGNLFLSGSAIFGSALSRANGGTGVTEKQSDVITLQNCTMDRRNCWHNGVVATVAIQGLKLTSSLTSGGHRNIGTVPSAFCPDSYVYAVAVSTTAAFSGKLFFNLSSTGLIQLYNESGSTLTSSDSVYATFTYVI